MLGILLGQVAGSAIPAAAADDRAPTTSVTSTATNPSVEGDDVVVTVTVTGGTTQATGQVEIADWGKGTFVVPLVDGRAQWTMPKASAGRHELRSLYFGDDTHAPSYAVGYAHNVRSDQGDLTYVGPFGGLWSTPTNWAPSRVPANGDVVVFPPDEGVFQTVNDIPDLQLKGIVGAKAWREMNLVVASGLTFTVTDSIKSDRLLTLQGPVVVPDGDLVIDGAGSVELRAGVTTGSVLKQGSGVLALPVASAIEGTVTVAGGGIHVGDRQSLGSPAFGTSVAPGGWVQLAKSAVDIVEPFALQGPGGPEGFGALLVGGAELQAPVHISGPTRLAFAEPAVASAPITGSGTLELFAQHGNTPVISLQEDRHDGPTRIESGLILNVDDTTSSLAGNVSVEGHLRLVGDRLVSGDVELAGRTPNWYPEVYPLRYGALEVRGSTILDGLLSSPDTLVDWVHALLVDAESEAILTGGFSGNGSIEKAGDGTFNLATRLPSSMAGTLGVRAGTVVAGGVTHSLPSVRAHVNGAVYFTVDDQFAPGATLSIRGADAWVDLLGTDQTVGALDIGGPLALGLPAGPDGPLDPSVVRTGPLRAHDDGALLMVVAGSDPGATHDAIVSSDVMLGGRLVLDVRPDLPAGTQVKLIDNIGSAPVRGAFVDLPEGGRIEGLRLSYVGGDGNDVVATVVPPPAPPPPPPAARQRAGYWMLGSTGAVYGFGDAVNRGAPARIGASSISPTPSGDGYWVLDERGRVHPFGDARNFGGSLPLRSGETATSLSSTPTGDGYWVFTSQGRALAYGNARHHGDMGAARLNGPVRGSVATPTGRGYYMVAADGGIFAFGDASFRGSMGSQRLNGPIVGLAPDPDGQGYWLVANDGGIFAFDAPFRGSMGGTRLNRPIIGMVAYGDGYLMVAGDGGIFNFSSKPFVGSLGANPPADPIVAVAALAG